MPRSLEAVIKQKLKAAFLKGMLYSPKTDSERRALKRRVVKGTVVSPYKGLYALKEQWTGVEKRQGYKAIIATLAELHPDWVFCSFSAAAIYELEVPYKEMDYVHIAATCSRCSHTLVCHHMSAGECATIDGIKCDALESAVHDCVRSSTFRYALAIADSSLRALGLGKDEMVERIKRRCKGRHGMDYVAQVFSYADGRAENGGESYARAVMIENGVMMPQLQVEHYDPVTDTNYREDFEWELKTGNVAGELDGYRKYTRIAQEQGKTVDQVLLEERQRESRLRNQGIQFARFSFDQLRNVTPFLDILDACGIPRTGVNNRAPKMPEGRRTIKKRKSRKVANNKKSPLA